MQMILILAWVKVTNIRQKRGISFLFTSYKDPSHLKSQDISKLFRAVGPSGKVFKRSLVMENHIEFEYMKYGEDKLFFFQLFSKVEKITMSTKPMYHVNRYDENKSLVQQTSMLDKASLNLAILDRTCRMDMPTQLKHMALSRMVEVDFYLEIPSYEDIY